MRSLKCIFISAPRGPIGTKPGRAISLTPTMYVLLPEMARYMLSTIQSTSMSVPPTNLPCLDIALQRIYRAGQTIIMRALFRVMAIVPASEWFWNGKRSHCPVGPFWNGNFCRSVLERFGRERSRSHCLATGGNGPDTAS